MDTDNPILTERFDDALTFAAKAHRRQVRKGSNVPYIGHLLGVASLVLEAGGDEDQAIAALLHDAVEDQGGVPMLEKIRRRFGPRVADIVDGCTDAVTIPKPEWRPRKEAYVEHLQTAATDTLLVSLADKLFNARAILQDYMRLGPVVWNRFSADADSQLWYYRALADTFIAFGDRLPVAMSRELDRVVRELKRLHASAPDATRPLSE